MSKPLPTGNFKWMKNLNNWRNRSCILEVDLEYPKELHDLHNEYPVAPESLNVGNVDKLIPNLKVLGKSVGLCKTTKRKDQVYISLLVFVWRIICEKFNSNGLILAEI